MMARLFEFAVVTYLVAPKSNSFTSPCSVIKIVSGAISQWIMSSGCTFISPISICDINCFASSGLYTFPVSRTSFNVVPTRYSDITYPVSFSAIQS